MKKILITCGLSIFLIPTFVSAVTFSDITALDEQTKLAIRELSADGVVHGYPDGNFYPQKYVTTGEFLKLILEPVLRRDFADEEEIMTDLEAGSIPDILAWAELKEDIDLLTGLNNINELATREKAAEQIIEVFDVPYTSQGVLGNPFADIVRGSDFERKVAYLFMWEVIVGRDETHFAPEDFLTRAEATKIAYLASEKFLAMRTLIEEETSSDTQNVTDNTTEEGITIMPYQMEILSVTPQSVMPGEEVDIIFAINNSHGRPITGVESSELHVSVTRGNALVDQIYEIGNGLYGISLTVATSAAPGPFKVDIVFFRGDPIKVSTSDFAVEATETQSLVRVFPRRLGVGERASIIATPQDHQGDPVSGLTLEAEVLHGSGRISTQMYESPAGSGVYVGEFLAASVAGEVEIVVRIVSSATRPEVTVPLTVY